MLDGLTLDARRDGAPGMSMHAPFQLGANGQRQLDEGDRPLVEGALGANRLPERSVGVGDGGICGPEPLVVFGGRGVIGVRHGFPSSSRSLDQPADAQPPHAPALCGSTNLKPAPWRPST